MGITAPLVGSFFVLFLVFSFLKLESKNIILSRPRSDWALDGVGLIFQGIAVPWLQTVLTAALMTTLLPGGRGSLNLDPLASFALSFIFVDYIYYWNHRLLHENIFWAFHRVHHSAKALDLFVTSRNSLVTPFLIVYLWVNGLFLYLLKDPGWFLAGFAFTSVLDLWRHIPHSIRPGKTLHRCLRVFFITPVEHAWHHSRQRTGFNFGANWSFWDRVHGTYYQSDALPTAFGDTSELSFWRKLFWPKERI